jgi:DNA-binding response OmpR family regulator
MKRILVIDDEELILDALGIILVQHGYDVSLASGGEEALKLINNGKAVDLVITDIHMPGMTGNDLARRMRRSKERFMPVIAVTGSPRSMVDETLFDDIVFKPFKVQELLGAVKRCMERGESGPTEALEPGCHCAVS